MNFTVRCAKCGKQTSVYNIEEADWIKYRDGALVQRVWPERSEDERNALIGVRTGFYLCDPCWDETMGRDFTSSWIPASDEEE